jgi:hypothetical protein
VFGRAEDVWAVCVLTGLSSGEGLIASVRDPVFRQESVKEKGRVVGYQTVTEDPGVTDKRVLLPRRSMPKPPSS